MILSAVGGHTLVDMIEEQQMRAAMQEYIDAFNRVDVDALIGLYAADATVEDPVGTDAKVGIEAIAEFYQMAIKSGAKLKLSAPIRASHGSSAAMAFEVHLNMPDGPAVIHAIDVMTFNEQGQFKTMQAYWGPGDLKPA
jgi:steroid delta-isomerase